MFAIERFAALQGNRSDAAVGCWCNGISLYCYPTLRLRETRKKKRDTVKALFSVFFINETSETNP